MAKIIIIEDHPHYREDLREALVQAGHKVCAYTCPSDAAKGVDFENLQPDVVISDNQMPYMTGMPIDKNAGINVLANIHSTGRITRASRLMISKDTPTILWTSEIDSAEETLCVLTENEQPDLIVKKAVPSDKHRYDQILEFINQNTNTDSE